MASERSVRDPAEGSRDEGSGPVLDGRRAGGQGVSGAQGDWDGLIPDEQFDVTGDTIQARAGPVALGAPAKRKGYRLRGGERYVREVGGDAVESVLVAYGGSPAGFGLFATPDVDPPERRGSFRAADLGPAEFCYTAAGRRLLATMGVVDADVSWPSEYEIFDETPGGAMPRMLGRTAEIVTVGGVTDAGTAVLAHVARVVHEGDVVFAVDARGRPLADRDLLLGDSAEAVYPTAALPAWGDWFEGVCEDVARTAHEPFYPGLADVAIAHPSASEAVTGIDGTLAESDRRVETGIDARPYAVVHPRAAAGGEFDRLTWAVRRRPTSAGRKLAPDGADRTPDGRDTPPEGPVRDSDAWVDAGRGECTTLRLTDEASGPTEYEIRVTARDERGEALATAVRTLEVDLWGY
jgi:hypothetical protein